MSTVLQGGTHVSAGSPAAHDALSGLRAEIEELDGRLVGLLAERVRLARRIAGEKAAAGLPLLDPPREAAVVRRAGTLARQAGLNEEEVRHLYWTIVGLTRRAQWAAG
jgi:chorismate mutase